jgi:hypothetical protein
VRLSLRAGGGRVLAACLAAVSTVDNGSWPNDYGANDRQHTIKRAAFTLRRVGHARNREPLSDLHRVWLTPAAIDPPADQEIHLWSVSLDRDQAPLAAWRQLPLAQALTSCQGQRLAAVSNEPRWILPSISWCCPIWRPTSASHCRMQAKPERGWHRFLPFFDVERGGLSEHRCSPRPFNF